MSEPIKVLIVDDIASTLDNLQKLLSFEPDIQVVATAVNGKEGVEQAKKVVPDIVLMDVNMPIMDGIQATEMLAQEAPGPQVFFVYSGKGGVGKSLIAANLAVSMANETKGKVALVDLDLQFGDIGVLLNLDHSQGITDLIENIDHMDPDFIREIMVDGPYGIKVLLTPISPELADLVTVDHVRRIFSELRKMFDYIIVDSSAHLGEINLEVLDHADRVVVVTSLSIPAIKNTKLALKIFDSLSISPDRVVLLLNKSDAHSEFNKESVEANLRFPIAGQIPNDPKLVINSINRGNPFVTTHPESEISQRIRELVAKVLPPAPVAEPESPEKKPRKGLFARR